MSATHIEKQPHTITQQDFVRQNQTRSFKRAKVHFSGMRGCGGIHIPKICKKCSGQSCDKQMLCGRAGAFSGSKIAKLSTDSKNYRVSVRLMQTLSVSLFRRCF